MVEQRAKKSGFSLIGILLIIGALILTAGGVVVWRDRGFPHPILTPESALPVVPDEDILNPPLLTTRTLAGIWKLIAYKNLITGEVEYEPEEIGRSIIIELKDNGRIGTIKGHTVANTLGPGRYELLENHRIKILKLATTLVFEPNWGVKFWNTIGKSSSYQIKGNSLLLYFNNGRELMEFVRQ